MVHTRFDTDWGGWVSEMTNEHYGASVCNHVRNGWERFFTFIKFEIGDGQCDRFCMNGGIEKER